MRFLILILLLFLGCDDDPVSPTDCAGVSGGDAVIDECGICNGDGTSCSFQFNLSVFDNSTPLSGASIYMYYGFQDIRFDTDADGIPPYETSIVGNYPNPFLAFTEIKFDIASASNIILHCKDLEGNVLSTIYEGHKDASPGYSVSFTPNPEWAPLGANVFEIELILDEIISSQHIMYMSCPIEFYPYGGETYGCSVDELLKIGELDNEGLLTLTSGYKKYFPTLYTIPDIPRFDDWNELVLIQLNNMNSFLNVRVEYNGVYKEFTTNIVNGPNNLILEWNEGEIYTP